MNKRAYARLLNEPKLVQRQVRKNGEDKGGRTQTETFLLLSICLKSGKHMGEKKILTAALIKSRYRELR